MARKFTEEDVFNIYKQSYRQKIIWNDILPEDQSAWLEAYEMSTNCSKTMILPSLLALTSTLCGPLTKISSNENAFVTPLNQYNFIVNAPGGGKSNTFSRIIEPVFIEIEKKEQQRFDLEIYTTAGIQKHQNSTNGYGIITGDEGERFLSTITTKQKNGESERALLCKMWNAKGDSSTILNGQRGFNKTSMSTAVFIQPQVLLQDMISLNAEDGLMDRILIYSSKPIFHKTEKIKQGMELMKTKNMKCFTKMFVKMFEDHKGKTTTYKLDKDAQETYDNYVDQFAKYMEEKYNSDSDDDKENTANDLTQSDTYLATSKDTSHVMRLAANLHILNHYWDLSMKECLEDCRMPPECVSENTLNMAMAIFNKLSQQKSVFIQAINQVAKLNTPIRIKKIKSFPERVARAVCRFPGPAVVLRDLQKHLKGALIDNIKHELQNMQKEGFGFLLSIDGRQTKIFMKSRTNSTPQNCNIMHKYLKMADMTVEMYQHIFNDLTKTSNQVKNVIRKQHPQMELLMDLIQ